MALAAACACPASKRPTRSLISVVHLTSRQPQRRLQYKPLRRPQKHQGIQLCSRETCQLVRHAIHTHVGGQVRDHGRKAAAARLRHVPRRRLFIREVCPFLQHYRLAPPFIRTGARVPFQAQVNLLQAPQLKLASPTGRPKEPAHCESRQMGSLVWKYCIMAFAAACFLPMT